VCTHAEAFFKAKPVLRRVFETWVTLTHESNDAWFMFLRDHISKTMVTEFSQVLNTSFFWWATPIVRQTCDIANQRDFQAHVHKTANGGFTSRTGAI